MWNINIHSMLSVYSQSEWRHGLHPDRALLGSPLLSSPPPTEATLAAPALRSGRCRGSTRPWKDECLLVEATHAPFSSPRAQTQQNKIKKHTGQFWRNFCPIVQLMKKKKGLFCRHWSRPLTRFKKETKQKLFLAPQKFEVCFLLFEKQ